jgi:small-conductance mechanosensitive channel
MSLIAEIEKQDQTAREANVAAYANLLHRQDAKSTAELRRLRDALGLSSEQVRQHEAAIKRAAKLKAEISAAQKREAELSPLATKAVDKVDALRNELFDAEHEARCLMADAQRASQVAGDKTTELSILRHDNPLAFAGT